MNLIVQRMRHLCRLFIVGMVSFMSACGGETQTTTMNKALNSHLTWDLLPAPGAVQSQIDALAKQGVQVIRKQCGRSEGPDYEGHPVITFDPGFIVFVEIFSGDVQKANLAGFVVTTDAEMRSVKVLDCSAIGQ